MNKKGLESSRKPYTSNKFYSLLPEILILTFYKYLFIEPIINKRSLFHKIAHSEGSISLGIIRITWKLLEM